MVVNRESALEMKGSLEAKQLNRATMTQTLVTLTKTGQQTNSGSDVLMQSSLENKKDISNIAALLASARHRALLKDSLAKSQRLNVASNYCSHLGELSGCMRPAN